MNDSRLRGLDTLRAAAILLVMFYHLNWALPEAFSLFGRFGWMGVDLFFVLSGYLIGAQILRPYSRGEQPGFAEFYRRRAYRILPAYLCTLLLYWTVPLWRERDGISPLWQFLTLTENLFVDYGRHQAFSHVWSLCVEEHFYIVLPLLIFWLMRRPSLPRVVLLITTVILLGMAVRCFALRHTLRAMSVEDDRFAERYIERVYYPTPARLDGLLVGVVAAAIQIFRPSWWRVLMDRAHATMMAGLSLCSLAVWLFWNRFESSTGVAAWGTVIGFPLLSAGLGLLLVSSVSRDGLLHRMRVPGARAIAMISFSLYLTHKEAAHMVWRVWPLARERTWLSLVLYGISCAAVGGALYWGVERPSLLLRDRGRRRAEWASEQARADPAL